MHHKLCIYCIFGKIIVMPKRKVIELPEDVAPIMKEIALRVVEYRKKIHPNYREFAEMKSISIMKLWRIQNGEDYKMSSFLHLLKKLDVTPEDFFKGIK